MQVLYDENGDVLWYVPNFASHSEAQCLYDQLHQNVAWHQEQLTMFGRQVSVPRLIAWYGDANAHYRYSGVDHAPLPWLPELLQWRDRISDYCQQPFNSVLLNLYRSGQDSMGWHSDDEPELGPAPWIASFSLGQRRRFKLRHRHQDRVINVDLNSGDLLLMGGLLQQHWQHCLPKSSKTMQPRINLTYRQILTARR